MSYVLKILAGTLNGVEYSVSGHETVFHVGPQEDLANGRAARLLAADDNAYFIPADLPVAAFAVRRARGRAGPLGMATLGAAAARAGGRHPLRRAWKAGGMVAGDSCLRGSCIAG